MYKIRIFSWCACVCAEKNTIHVTAYEKKIMQLLTVRPEKNYTSVSSYMPEKWIGR